MRLIPAQISFLCLLAAASPVGAAPPEASPDAPNACHPDQLASYAAEAPPARKAAPKKRAPAADPLTCKSAEMRKTGFPSGRFGPFEVCVSDVAGTCGATAGSHLRVKNFSRKTAWFRSDSLLVFDFLKLEPEGIAVVRIPRGRTRAADTHFAYKTCAVVPMTYTKPVARQ